MKKPKLFDLNDALQHPGRHVTFGVCTVLPEEQDLDLIEPVTGDLDAVSTGNLLLITGSFHARAVVECARCLEPVEVDVEFELEEEFPVEGTPAGFHSQGFAHVLSDEDSELFEGNSLVADELLRQNIWLNLPTKPLCRDTCRGLLESGSESEPVHPEFTEIAEKLRRRERSS